MNKQITIQKNASCQFSLLLTNKVSELTKELQSIKDNCEKEFIFISTVNTEHKDIKEICDTFHSECVFTKKENIRQIIENSIKENKILVWFTAKDYETVISLNDLSVKNLNYILIPITPIAQMTCEYIYDIWNKKAIEVFPLAILMNTAVWTEANAEDYTSGLASVLRKGIQENAAFYEWFLGNMYEVFDKEEEFIYTLLEKNAALFQKRLDKKTAAQRCVPHFGAMFEYCISNACKELQHADVISMSCLMHAYLAWGKQILSMEEFYEIRDMFVAFDMRISETNAKAEVLIDYLREDKTDYAYGSFEEFPYLNKIGKIITNSVPTEKDLLDAAMAVYFDEEAMA